MLLQINFIVCGISLCVLNRIPGQEGVYICATVAGLVCITGVLFAGTAPDLYASTHLNLWLILLAFSGILMGGQLHKFGLVIQPFVFLPLFGAALSTLLTPFMYRSFKNHQIG